MCLGGTLVSKRFVSVAHDSGDDGERSVMIGRK